MAGVTSNATLGGDQGIGSSNYDYLQHTTIHPQPNPPQQSQPINYYPQQQPHEASYLNNHHQYYHQQQYYQPPPQTDQQEPWPPVARQHPDNNHYHQQQYYQQPQPQQYHPNQNYHQQQQPPQHAPILQLSSFVNHSHPQSPSPGVMYPNSSTPAGSSAALVSPPPQGSISPVRPGPGSSPGAASNHMMPVRLQNMAKGARTKAGMRKLMQMQGQQGHNSKMEAPPNTIPNANTKKAKGKKLQMADAKTPPTNSKSPSTNAKSPAEETSPESRGKSPAAGNSNRQNSSSRTPSPRGQRLEKAKTPPSSPSKKGQVKGQQSPRSSPPKSITTDLTTPTPAPSSLFCPTPRPITIENVDPFYQGQKPIFNSSSKTPKPSDVLFEKLGLDKEKKPPPKRPIKTKDPPVIVKKRRDSTSTLSSDQSHSEDLPDLEEHSVVHTAPKTELIEPVRPRTRRNYSGSTDDTTEDSSSIKSSSPVRSPSPPSKRKTNVMSKSKQVKVKKEPSTTPKRTPSSRKVKEDRDSTMSSSCSPPLRHSAKDKDTPISAQATPEIKTKRKYTKRKLANSRTTSTKNTPKHKSLESSKVDFTAASVSIAEVAAAIVQPGLAPTPIKHVSAPAALASTPAQSTPAEGEVRTKRKYVRRKPLKSQIRAMQAQLSAQRQAMMTNSTTVKRERKRKGDTAGQTKLSVTLPPEISVIPIQSPIGTKIKSEPGLRTKRKYTYRVRNRKQPKTATKLKDEKKEVSTEEEEEEGGQEEANSAQSSPDPHLRQIGTRSGSSVWIEATMEKKRLSDGKMKKPTIWAKSAAAAPQTGTTDVSAKKEPGPSLKVKHGMVKFYRGNVEEDVDEAFKKLDVVLKDSVGVSKDCDDDSPWLCIFCGLGPHDMRLGDLFGPYYVHKLSDNKHNREASKTEVWVHTDCALWAGDVILVGSTLRNLDEAVYEAGKVACNICQNAGATIGCLKRGCKETAHFPCAKLNDWSLNGETFRSHCSAHLAEAHKKC